MTTQNFTDLTLAESLENNDEILVRKENGNYNKAKISKIPSASVNIIETPSIVLWDSVANTLSQREREVEDINSVIGYKGRLLSLLIPKYISKLSNYNICLLIIDSLLADRCFCNPCNLFLILPLYVLLIMLRRMCF
jgi:hypothetical protein